MPLFPALFNEYVWIRNQQGFTDKTLVDIPQQSFPLRQAQGNAMFSIGPANERR